MFEVMNKFVYVLYKILDSWLDVTDCCIEIACIMSNIHFILQGYIFAVISKMLTNDYVIQNEEEQIIQLTTLIAHLKAPDSPLDCSDPFVFLQMTTAWTKITTTHAATTTAR